MASIKANGIKIEYERAGDPNKETVLLIMGLGAQLILWPDELVDILVKRGFQVIRFDNRDIGLSEKFDSAPVPDMFQLVADSAAGKTPDVPYTLSDMADDAAALLSALNIKKAHIVGASMGGMIAQLVAANHPDHVLSLTSIMSTTGNPELPQGTPEAMEALLSPVADPNDLEEAIKRGQHIWATIGSPGYPRDKQSLLHEVKRTVTRSYYPAGVARQTAAILADGDRRERLKKITAPTIVLHGEDDPLVPIQGGEDTAAAISGAQLRRVAGMGHDIPPELYETYANAICEAAKGSARGGDEAEALSKAVDESAAKTAESASRFQ